MGNTITENVSKFCTEVEYEDLPQNAIHETKRSILDTIGCALGGLETDKGSLGLKFAQMAGGPPEAIILGTGEKVAVSMAAFANGETMHALDSEALLPPGHVAAFVIPAPLGLAEMRNASGKELILAVALSLEVASRIGTSLGGFRTKTGAQLRSYGFGSCIFGAAAGAGRIMRLDSEKMADAFGIAGYFAPVPSHQKYVFTPYNGLQKYGPAGWTAQGGVTAAILAEMGERGDRSVLDGDYGFWAMNGSPSCNWDMITDNLGTKWCLLQVKYKRWPACALMLSPLRAFTNIIEHNNLQPEEIVKVLVKNDAQNNEPQFLKKEVHNNCDAQNSIFYNIAVAAHRIKLGPLWQARSTMENPNIQAFMNKVKFEVYAKADEVRYHELTVEKRNYLNRRPARVEVTARGKVFTEEIECAEWITSEAPGFPATDEDLINKFRENTENVLSTGKTKKAIDMILNLEKVNDANELIKVLIR